MVGVEETSTPRGVALRVGRWCLPFLVSAAVVFGFFVAVVHGTAAAVSGDEPHYLVFADALRHGTFDVRAAYQDPAGVTKWIPGLTPDQTVVHAGHLRSIRMPLLPLLLAPAMALGSLTLARLTMVLIAAALLDQLWRLLGDLGYRGFARAGPWLATLTALPMLGYGTHLYPETPGALCVVVALRLLVRRTRRSLVAASAVAGLLPWLIVRFTALALALLVVAVVLVARPASWHVRDVGRALREHARDVALVVAPCLVSMVAFLVYVRVLYGSFDPRTVYPPGFTQPWTPWNAYVVGIGSLFGATEGLLPYAPAFLLALVGLVVAARRYRAVGWFLLGVAAFHLLVVVPMGFYGLALPGRFVIVLVPLLAVAMAEALRVAPILDVALVALLAVQVVTVALYHEINDLIFDHIPQYSYLAVFPAVVDEPGNGAFALSITQGAGPVARVDGGGLRADKAAGPGVIYASDKIMLLRHAHYHSRFALSANEPVPATTKVARLTVTELPGGRVLADRSVDASQLAQPIGVDFETPGQPEQATNRVAFEVDTTGAADLELHSLTGAPIAPRPRDRVIHDDVPLSIAWLATLGVGALLLTRLRRGRRPSSA